MGHSNERPSQLTVSTQKNNSVYAQTFDFTKPKVLISTQKLMFPSYLTHNRSLNEIVYSTINSNPNQYAIYNKRQTFSEEVYLVRNNKLSAFSLWQLIEAGEKKQLKEGDRIRIGKAEVDIKQIRTSLADVKEDQILTADVIGPDSMIKSSIVWDEGLEESRFSRGLASRVRTSGMVESRYVNQKGGAMSRKSMWMSVQRQCRFCFESSQDRSNPLLNICECAGSVAHIHFKCLQRWIKSKSGRTQTSHCIYYIYEPLRCQICKAYLSNEVEAGGRKYVLMATQQMHPPYLKLSYQLDGKLNEILVRLEGESRMSLGRGGQNQIEVKEKTVSRSHCCFFYSSHSLYLQANPSKYGTFLAPAPNTPLILTPEHPITLLLHNTLLVFKWEKQEKKGWEECCTPSETYALVVK